MQPNTSDNETNNEHDVVIRQEDIKPITDPNCAHHFVKDSDEIGNMVAWVCNKPKCGRGVFLPKGVTIT